MSLPLPLIVLSLAFSAFVSVTPAQEAAPPTASPLNCRYADNYFRVSDGKQKWEKYVANWTKQEAKVVCGDRAAAALIGSYFVYFYEGQIRDLHVGSFADDRLALALEGDFAAAVMGSYFVTARGHREILQQIVGKPDAFPLLAVSPQLAVSVMGSRFVVSDGESVRDFLVGGGTQVRLATRAHLGGALTGSHFAVAVAGEFYEWQGSNRHATDHIVAGDSLIAAAMGPWFVVFDANRRSFFSYFVGEPGTVSVVGELALFETKPGRFICYDGLSGSF